MQDNTIDKLLDDEHILFNFDDSLITNSHYLYGSCHLFALVYSEVTGAEIGCLMSESEFYSESEQQYFSEVFLDHAFCFHPENKNLIIDAKGIRYLTEIEAQYISGMNSDIVYNSTNFINSWIKQNKLSYFKPNEKELLKSYLLNFFIPNNYDKTEEEIQSIKISEFLNRKIARNIVNEIKNEFPDINFNNAEEVRGQCSFFNVLVMKKLNDLNIQSKSLLCKKDENFHNATLFSNIVIDMTAAQFDIYDSIFEHNNYLKLFKLVNHVPSKRLKL